MARKKLGEMLIEAGVLDEPRLRQALADQRRWGRTLGRTLVDMNLLTEETLVSVLSRQLGVQSVDLDAYDVPPRVLALVPAELARQHHLVPFAQPMKFLDVAMADPTNLGVVDELRIRTQLNIRPFLGGPRQIEAAIAKYYGHGLGARADIEITWDSPDTYEPEPQLGPAGATTVRGRRASRQRITDEGIRPYPPSTIAPPLATASPAEVRDAEIASLQSRLAKLEALVERDEQVLRKLLALLIEKNVATREEILERLS
jgi:type IV pilus assembly protein PilB